MKTAALVYGHGPALDDPAELYHESSKMYPSFGARQTRGHVLERSVDLRHSALRAVKRSSHLPAVSLPEPALPTVPFGEVVEARRSEREFGLGRVSLYEVAALAHAAYGITGHVGEGDWSGERLARSIPSGGALYPLELYAFAHRVRGFETGLYHFDPLRRVLEVIRRGSHEDAVGSTSVYSDLVRRCSVLFVVTGMFWRTRFKYGLRGYRFALIEAGHLAQNLLLTATALGLASLPIGGFFDRRMDDLLQLDGVNESMLYAIGVARRKERGAQTRS